MQPELITQADDGLMGAASALAHRLRLPTTLIKFVMVGGTAFLIYQFFLLMFYTLPVLWFLPDKEATIDPLPFGLPELGLRLLIVSIVALELAIVFQFRSHERWTFRSRNRAGWRGAAHPTTTQPPPPPPPPPAGGGKRGGPGSPRRRLRSRLAGLCDA